MAKIDEDGSWNIWSKHVLKELERLNECYESLLHKVGEIEKDVVVINKECKAIDEIRNDIEQIKNKLAVANGIEEGKRNSKHDGKESFQKSYKIWMIILTILMVLSSVGTIIVALKH